MTIDNNVLDAILAIAVDDRQYKPLPVIL